MRALPEWRALVSRGGHVPAAAERGEACALETSSRGRIAAIGLEQLVARALQDVARHLLERERVVAAHLVAPVAEAGCRWPREVPVLGHRGYLGGDVVLRHPGFPVQRRVFAHTPYLPFRLGD